MIYFIADLQNSVCKIGFSNNVSKRLKALQTGYPYELNILHTEEGEIENELAYHARFASLKLDSKEWFSLNGELLEFVKTKDIYMELDHIKSFTDHTSELMKALGASAIAYRLLYFLMVEVKYNTNIFTVTQELKDKALSVFGLRGSSFLTQLAALAKTGVIYRLKKGEYIINPKYMFKGSVKARLKQLDVFYLSQGYTLVVTGRQRIYSKEVPSVKLEE